MSDGPVHSITLQQRTPQEHNMWKSLPEAALFVCLAVLAVGIVLHRLWFQLLLGYQPF
ncbi:MAG: hypothetical protein AAGI12_01120 [Pseudomonadota bacterium]